MKKVLLSVGLIITMIQAENVVHYDTSAKEEAKLNETTLSKPNHPSSSIYVKYDGVEKK